MGRTFSELLSAKRRVKELDALVADLERQLAEARAEAPAEAPAGERIEIPEFQVYGIQRHYFVNKLEGLGIEPIEIDNNLILNGWYYYTSLESWGEILEDLVISSNLYRQDKFACDAYAFKAQVECAERYGLNSLRMCIKKTTTDGITTAHAFNLFPYGGTAGIEDIMLFEPNEGYDWDGILELGDFSYEPKYVLV